MLSCHRSKYTVSVKKKNLRALLRGIAVEALAGRQHETHAYFTLRVTISNASVSSKQMCNMNYFLLLQTLTLIQASSHMLLLMMWSLTLFFKVSLSWSLWTSWDGKFQSLFFTAVTQCGDFWERSTVLSVLLFSPVVYKDMTANGIYHSVGGATNN